MLIEAGIPTLCGFGPQGNGAHAPDEWVELASLPQTIAMYARIIRDYLNPSNTRHSERNGAQRSGVEESPAAEHGDSSTPFGRSE